MLKTLLKKELMQFFSFITFDRRKGKRRSKSGIILVAVLYLFLLAYVGINLYLLMSAIAKPLVDQGFGWFYFALASLIALFFGILGSVMSTYGALYSANDNDLLLSLPIKPGQIILSRLVGVYVLGLLYSFVCIVPALAAYYIACSPDAKSVILSLFVPIVISFFVLFLSCVLGWVVALIAKRVKHKNIFTVVLSLLFMAAYYAFYTKAMDAMKTFVISADSIAPKVKNYVYPLYRLGLGAMGDTLSMLIVMAFAAVLCVLAYLLISKSFAGIVSGLSTNKTSSKHVSSAKLERGVRVHSVDRALLSKELRRFSASPIYMLNCGLGAVMMVALSVLMMLKGGELFAALERTIAQTDFYVIACGAFIMLCSMCMITAPSVSLEGKQIDVVRMLPIPTVRVLKAKVMLHHTIMAIPVVVFIVCALLTVKPDPLNGALIAGFCIVYNFFVSEFGLSLDLRFANIHWVSETVPVKQGLPVLFSTLSGLIAIIVFGAIYLLLRNRVPVSVYLGILLTLTVIIDLALYKWISTKGAARFERIQ